MGNIGEPIHMEAIRASGTGNTTFSIFKMGRSDAYTLKSTEFITITDIVLVMPAGGPYTIAVDTDAAGKRVVKGAADLNGGLAHHFETPFLCPVGVTPVLIASTTGEADCVMTGFLCQN